jgi:hypothetical protein
MKWLEENWKGLLFIVVAALVLSGAIAWAMKANRDVTELFDSCIDAGYAGIEKMEGLGRWMCYSSFEDGRITAVDARHLLAETQGR